MVPRRIPSAHSASEGPATTGPSASTVSSVKIETSAAREFISSSGLSSARQMRPAPGMCGSITSTCRGAAARRSAVPGREAFAPSRSSTPIARGPPPTITRRVGTSRGATSAPVTVCALCREFIRADPF
jgi:hypothetical protein